MLFFSTRDNLALFLSGKGKDRKGRTLDDILRKDDIWWDRTHDFIQWVFPNKERSRYNLLAPVYSASDALEYPDMEKSFERFCRFLNNTDWKHKGNHNLLRITRVIKSLRLFGRDDLADLLLIYVMDETKDIKGLEKSRVYWLHA